MARTGRGTKTKPEARGDGALWPPTTRWRLAERPSWPSTRRSTVHLTDAPRTVLEWNDGVERTHADVVSTLQSALGTAR